MMDPVERTPARPVDPSAAPVPGPHAAEPILTGSPAPDGRGQEEMLPESPRRRRRGTKQLVEWLLLVAGALAIALLIKAFVFQAFYIPSESMVPTLQRNDRVLVNKLSYRLHDVNRGDIVVFSAPEGEAQDGVNDLVKRVVGLPGETIEGRDGRVLVDSRPLDEDYLPDGTVTRAFGPERIPPDSYFVMGDNRQASKDSTVFGPVPEDDIVGRVFVRIWPVSRVGFI